MNKRVFIYMCLIGMLVGCSGRPKQYVIAVSSCSNDMWREQLNEELTVSTYMYDNVKLKIQSANDDDKRQIEQINAFVDEGVDLLVVSPNQLKTISPAINHAFEKHIPVLLFDRKTDTDKYTAYIGADNFKVGCDMGEYVTKIMQGRGNLVIINGLRGSSPAIERRRGFLSVISKYPNIHIVGECYAGWLYDEAVAGMDSILSRTTNIDCVFAQNDRMALGARHAVVTKGVKRHIDYVGVDALPTKGGGLECVDAGLLTASYIYPTRGDLVLSLAMNILTGKHFERENSMQGALVTKDNAHALLLQNEELSKQRERLYAVHDKVNMYFAEYNHQRVYTILAIIIILLLLVSFAMMYRISLIRRRMTEQTAEAKLTFFTNVSHEFRTPLTLIIDPVDRLLTDLTLGEHQHALLQMVRKNVDVMLRLVGEILDFRKVQNGKMTIRTSRFDLSECIEQWINDFRPIAERKNISLSVHADKQIDIVADRDKVEKIMSNLLSNALKYTPTDGHIDVEVHEKDSNVVLQVVDNGQGMSPDDCKHAFERFWQANKSTSGTGIGLALVKAFAEMHHGSAAVESIQGKGTTFTITLPLIQHGATADEASVPEITFQPIPSKDDEGLKLTTEQTATDRITALDPQFGQNPVVLVVDDSAAMRTYIADILQANYEVLLASDGNEGLQQALKEVPDIVVCDVMMPGIDGLELCRRLKTEIVTSHIPVIMLTARAMEEQRAEGYDCGADAYITKPFSSKVLTARIHNLLETRRHLKSLYSSGDVPDGRKGDADSRFMADFNRIVMSKMADSGLSVEDVSGELGLSRVQMYRKVKALTGSTPVELIRIMRLKRADRLLKQGGRTVSEVSYEVGFSSPSYFTKCFKDYFNRLPSE